MYAFLEAAESTQIVEKVCTVTEGTRDGPLVIFSEFAMQLPTDVARPYELAEDIVDHDRRHITALHIEPILPAHS